MSPERDRSLPSCCGIENYVPIKNNDKYKYQMRFTGTTYYRRFRRSLFEFFSLPEMMIFVNLLIPVKSEKYFRKNLFS